MESIFTDAKYQMQAAERAGQWLQLDEAGRAGIIATELARCPCWEDLWGDEPELAAGIVRLYSRLCIFDDVSIKRGIAVFLERYCSPDNKDLIMNRARVFLFLRVLYQVPDSFPESQLGAERSSLGIFWYVPKPGSINLLAPLKEESPGRLIIAPTPEGAFYGHGPYEPMKDLEFLKTHFPRRKWKESAEGVSFQHSKR